MRLLIDIEKNSFPIECARESPIAHILAGLPINNWPDFGTIVACKNLEWRLSKADLNITIGAEDGELISIEKTNYEETHFELPPLGDKMNNLIRSIVVTRNPGEKLIESLKSAKCRDDFVKLKNDRNYLAHTSFGAPPIFRFVLSHPDDLGGFMLVYQKWSDQQQQKMKSLDERLEYTMNHTPELLTPPSTLYIRGLINGHEVAAMIDTGVFFFNYYVNVPSFLVLKLLIAAVMGVGGKTRPLGKVFGIDYQLSMGSIAVSAIILPSDGTMSNHFILGLDVMLCHGCVIDLPNRRLTFSGHHEPILSVEECNKIDKAKHGSLH